MMQEATLGPAPPRVVAVKEMLMSNPLPVREEIHAGQDLLAFRDKVYLLCLGFVGNAADAHDLAQDTYAKALLHYPQVRPDNPQAWVMRIARNTCLDQARRRKVRGPQEPVHEGCAADADTPEEHAGRQEEIAIVRRAIARLPRRQREVLVMREYGELSYGEIAAALRITTGTVMSRLNRARQAVLRLFQEEHHGKES